VDALTTVIVIAALAGVPVVVTVAGTVRGGVESRLSLRVPEITDTSLLTSMPYWSPVLAILWSSWVTPSSVIFEELHLPEPSLYIMLELGVEPFAHLLETRQRQIKLPHHPLVVLGHLLKLHENGSHVELFLDDVTSYDKFLAHRLEAPTALLLQTNAEADTHFGHEVILHKVHLQPLEASPSCGLVDVHVGVIVLQKLVI